jgi:hypothetical protein
VYGGFVAQVVEVVEVSQRWRSVSQRWWMREDVIYYVRVKA